MAREKRFFLLHAFFPFPIQFLFPYVSSPIVSIYKTEAKKSYVMQNNPSWSHPMVYWTRRVCYDCPFKIIIWNKADWNELRWSSLEQSKIQPITKVHHSLHTTTTPLLDWSFDWYILLQFHTKKKRKNCDIFLAARFVYGSKITQGLLSLGWSTEFLIFCEWDEWSIK